MEVLIASSMAQASRFLPYTTTWLDRLASFVGIFGLLGLAWLMSERRAQIKWRTVWIGLGLTFALSAISLSPTISTFFYDHVNAVVDQLLKFSDDGANFVFGTFMPHAVLVDGTAYPVLPNTISPPLKTFAFVVLPTIIFFSALMSVLYYIGIMRWVVDKLAIVMVKTMGTTGPESLSAAGNIFLGQTEAPLLVKPFIRHMSRSELMTVMTGGFATVAGGVMGAYLQFLQGVPNIAGHLVMASILATPASIAISKLMVPEGDDDDRSDARKSAAPVDDAADDTPQPTNVVEAAASGAMDGLSMALAVGGTLIAFVALVHLVDAFLGLLPIVTCNGNFELGYTCAIGQTAQPFSMSMILGIVFFPIALFMGIPWGEAWLVGTLLGEKIVLTELLAYSHLGEIIRADVPRLSERSVLIASYALCGFANFASIGIQIAGLQSMAPNQLSTISSLGVRAMIAGTLTTCIVGCVVGVMM